jgi:hypothetical protein
MTTNIALMGPHALASYHSRKMALESFGIDPITLSLYKTQDRSLAKQSRSKRALMIQEEHAMIVQEEHPLMLI